MMKLVLILMMALILSGCPMMGNLREYKRIVSEIEIEEVDLTGLEDGIYYGTVGAILVSAEVWVTMSENKIANIKLIHEHDRGEKAEPIIDTVKEKQTLKVDMITGATSSSKVILKAIENALTSKPIEGI